MVGLSKYSQVISELGKRLDSASDVQEKSKIYAGFSQNYFTPISIWSERITLDRDNLLEDKHLAAEFFQQQQYHFCYQIHIVYSTDSTDSSDFLYLNVSFKKLRIESRTFEQNSEPADEPTLRMQGFLRGFETRVTKRPNFSRRGRAHFHQARSA